MAGKRAESLVIDHPPQQSGWRHGLMIVCCAAGCVGLGAMSAAISPIDPWYEALHKPVWMPPGWAFAVVWTLLYAAMGVGLAVVLEKGWRSAGVRSATVIFTIQLLLNLAWSPTFFRFHSVTSALTIIIVLWLLIGWTVAAFWSVKDVAGVLLLPYWGWVTFAVGLNAVIWRLN